VLSHWSEEFKRGFIEALELTKMLFQTEGHPFILAGSGTLGMEAAIANIIERGDHVLCVENGFFGERWSEIVKAHGGIVQRLTFEWGEPIDTKLLEERLSEGDYKAFTVEHVDTSTGIANSMEEIGRLARGTDAICIVDSVCGVGGMPLKMDEWGLDLCLTGSQKALGAPPGLTLLCLNEKAWSVVEGRETSVADYFADLRRWGPIMKDPSGYFATPATGMVLGLLEALRLIKEEGLENRWRRHQVFSEAFRAGLRVIGLESFPAEGYEAYTVSVAKIPAGVDDAELRRVMRERHGVTIAGGLGKLKGKTIRVGHMGTVTVPDLTATMSSLEMGLKTIGYEVKLGSGVGALEERLLPYLSET
jgi:aspartate aminotransferase-like enzyme